MFQWTLVSPSNLISSLNHSGWPTLCPSKSAPPRVRPSYMISSQSSVSPVGRQRPPRLAQGSPQSATATDGSDGWVLVQPSLKGTVGGAEDERERISKIRRRCPMRLSHCENGPPHFPLGSREARDARRELAGALGASILQRKWLRWCPRDVCITS